MDEASGAQRRNGGAQKGSETNQKNENHSGQIHSFRDMDTEFILAKAKKKNIPQKVSKATLANLKKGYTVWTGMQDRLRRAHPPIV